MAYVQVPKDLTQVKTKVMLNLTKRQLICFSLGALAAVPTYLLMREVAGSTLAAIFMIVTVMPFLFFAIYEKDGRHMEKILMMIYRQKFQRPGVRPYKTDNFYSMIQREIYEREVLGIGYEEKYKASTKGFLWKGKDKDKGKK